MPPPAEPMSPSEPGHGHEPQLSKTHTAPHAHAASLTNPAVWQLWTVVPGLQTGQGHPPLDPWGQVGSCWKGQSLGSSFPEAPVGYETFF